ncbi:hypothetical protein [Streptomyces sp. NPDC088256]|uniref:hypothetical protein n=1 Tax=Streptomyces sp. NPDC088256 TaxID=3365848 RepID=UPI0037F68571
MLQCTGLTGLPEFEASAALRAMDSGPDHLSAVLALHDHVLCELGEHGEHTEHAAKLWAVAPPADCDLWMFWAGTGIHHVIRFAELPRCLAPIRRPPVRHMRVCLLFERHPAAHSWDVTDPLRTLLTGLGRQDVRRLYTDGQGDAD